MLIIPSHSWVPARVIPAPAAAVGFNTRTFFDDFNSSSTIDLSLTKTAGFNWYLSNAWPNALNSAGTWNSAPDTDPASISVSNSSFIKTTSAATINQGIHTAIANGSTWRGTTFKNGFYAEIRFKINPFSSGSQNFAWPIYWFMPTEFLTDGARFFTELDGWELFSGSNDLAIHDWDIIPPTDHVNSNASWSTGPSDTNFHTMATLWQTATQGGGTGSIKRYFDGALQSANTVTWTPGNFFSGLDAQHMVMIIDTGIGVTMTVDYVDICQTSSADIVVQS